MTYIEIRWEIATNKRLDPAIPMHEAKALTEKVTAGQSSVIFHAVASPEYGEIHDGTLTEEQKNIFNESVLRVGSEISRVIFTRAEK